MNKNNLTQGNDQSTELEVFLGTVVANLLKRFVNRQASFILLLLTFAFLRNISQNTVIKIGFKNVSSNIKTQSSLEFNGQEKLLSRTFKGKTSLTTFDCAASTFYDLWTDNGSIKLSTNKIMSTNSFGFV